MDQLAQQLGITIDLYDTLIGWGLIFTRIFVMLILTPFLGGRGVSGRIRMLTAIVLSVYVYVVFQGSLSGQLPEDKGLIIALFFVSLLTPNSSIRGP